MCVCRSKRIEKLGGDPEVEGGRVQLVAEGAGAEPPSHAHQGGRQHLQLACQQVHSPQVGSSLVNSWMDQVLQTSPPCLFQRAEHTPPEGVGQLPQELVHLHRVPSVIWRALP